MSIRLLNTSSSDIDISQTDFEVINFPTIEVMENNNAPLVQILVAQLAKADWIIFPSKNAVRIFLEILAEQNYDRAKLKPIKIASMGSSTSALIEEQSLEVSFVPSEFVAEKFVHEFSQIETLLGRKIILLRSQIGRDLIAAELTKLGAEVFDAPIYNTLIPQYEQSEIAKMQTLLKAQQIDFILFTSPSTAENFFALIGKEFFSQHQGHIKLAAIGPVTKAAIESVGFPCAIMPDKHTIAGLLEEIKLSK
ncbi:MAG: uroporphyrinogen-III synthase [Deltaproteobacteria bacterium]|nr:uroporphyrinogen-III synthase [Deltaproteobacteria bacterium]